MVAIGKEPRKRVIHGTLEDFFETGTEGVVWSVSDDDDIGYPGLHPIKEGDHLTILDELGQRIWAGRISATEKPGGAVIR